MCRFKLIVSLLLLLLQLQWRIEDLSAFVVIPNNNRHQQQQQQQRQQQQQHHQQIIIQQQQHRIIKWNRIHYKSSSYSTSRQKLLQVQQQQQQQQQRQHLDDSSISSESTESTTTTTIFPETNYLLNPKLLLIKISNIKQQQRQRQQRRIPLQQQNKLSNNDTNNSKPRKSIVSLLITNTNFLYQFVLMILLYIFHLTILTQYQLVLPFQLIPFSLLSTIIPFNYNFYKGCCIGYDSIAGIIIVVYYCYIQNKQQYQYQYQYQLQNQQQQLQQNQNQQQQQQHQLKVQQKDIHIQNHEEQDKETTGSIVSGTQEDILLVNDAMNINVALHEGIPKSATTSTTTLATESESEIEIEATSVSDTVSDTTVVPADGTIISDSSLDLFNNDNNTTRIDDDNNTTIGSSSSSIKNTSSFKLIRSVYNPELTVQQTVPSIDVSTIDTSSITTISEQTTSKNKKPFSSSSSPSSLTDTTATATTTISSSSFIHKNSANTRNDNQQRFKLLPNLFTSPSYNNDATPWNLPSYIYNSHNEQNNNNNNVININQVDDSISIQQDKDTTMIPNDINEQQQQLTFQEKITTIVNAIKSIIEYITTPYRLLRVSYIVSTTLLIIGYFNTAKLTLLWEDCIYSASAKGFPITVPLQRSLMVLIGHLSWVLIGTTILTLLPQPSFFTRNVFAENYNNNNNTDEPIDSETDVDNIVDTNKENTIPFYKWFTIQLHNPNKQWVWWSIGGYYVSSWLFNVADAINQVLLPAQVLFGTFNGLDGSMNSAGGSGAVESVVTQLVNPEYNDFIASLVGYIAPCISAPIWEELLYRGYLLPGLIAIASRIRRTRNDTSKNTKNSTNTTTNIIIEDTNTQRIKSTTYHWVCVIQALIFSAHHMSINAAVPLAVLGYIWAVVYTKSQNLLTVILIHSMWNSRVFLGSWLGL